MHEPSSLRLRRIAGVGVGAAVALVATAREVDGQRHRLPPIVCRQAKSAIPNAITHERNGQGIGGGERVELQDVTPIHRGETRGIQATRIVRRRRKQVSLRAIGIGNQQL